MDSVARSAEMIGNRMRFRMQGSRASAHPEIGYRRARVASTIVHSVRILGWESGYAYRFGFGLPVLGQYRLVASWLYLHCVPCRLNPQTREKP